MANQVPPTVDQWYARRDNGELFHVVAVDEEADAIQIQNFEGDIEELDAEAWGAMDIEPVDPPENWTGPFDDLETDDIDDSESAMRPRTPPEPPLGQQELWREGPLDDRKEGNE